VGNQIKSSRVTKINSGTRVCWFASHATYHSAVASKTLP